VGTASPQYEAAKAIYNKYPASVGLNSPDFVYDCRSLADVMSIVRVAFNNNLKVAIKSGGRSMEGFNTCSGNCVQINLQNYQDYTVDMTTMTANISAGYSNGELYTALKKQGLGFVSGTCKPVGFAGLSLGGGLSILMREHGIAVSWDL
jgi:FAD/FMN-containing dehydrogenase